MKQLFTQIQVPPPHRKNMVAHRAAWYSWSPEFLCLLGRSMDGIRALPDPPCVSVRGCDPYGSTYSYRLSALSSPVVRFALEAGEALLRVRTGNRMRFLSGMLDPPLTSPVLHKCFALIRTAIARLRGDSRAALHAPVKTERVDDGVPLHFDLFLTERLWLVFDNVPEDQSGKSLFLPLHLFEAAIESNYLIPSVTRRRLRTLLRGKPGLDSFDECYDAIYSADNPWTPLLAQTMKQYSWTIRLHRGEGYLVNDRQWLHGRTAVRAVSPPLDFAGLFMALSALYDGGAFRCSADCREPITIADRLEVFLDSVVIKPTSGSIYTGCRDPLRITRL